MGLEKKKKFSLKLKKPVPKASITGNWKESDVTSTCDRACSMTMHARVSKQAELTRC